MKSIIKKLTAYGAAGIVVVLILLAAYGASWMITCGIIKIITLCFRLDFDLAIATGIWLILVLVKLIILKGGK